MSVGKPRHRGREEVRSRLARLPQIGRSGLERLEESSVAIVGVGALGTHATQSLARIGVGRLILIDRDIVELSNLDRQVLFDEVDAREGRPKAVAAAAASATAPSNL